MIIMENNQEEEKVNIDDVDHDEKSSVRSSSPSTVSMASSGSPLVRSSSNNNNKRPAPTSIAAAQLQCQQQRQLEFTNQFMKNKHNMKPMKMSSFAASGKKSKSKGINNYYQQQQQQPPLYAPVVKGDQVWIPNVDLLQANNINQQRKQFDDYLKNGKKTSTHINKEKSAGCNLAKTFAFRVYRLNEFWSVNKLKYMNFVCLLMTLICLITILLFSSGNNNTIDRSSSLTGADNNNKNGDRFPRGWASSLMGVDQAILDNKQHEDEQYEQYDSGVFEKIDSLNSQALSSPSPANSFDKKEDSYTTKTKTDSKIAAKNVDDSEQAANYENDNPKGWRNGVKIIQTKGFKQIYHREPENHPRIVKSNEQEIEETSPQSTLEEKSFIDPILGQILKSIETSALFRSNNDNNDNRKLSNGTKLTTNEFGGLSFNKPIIRRSKNGATIIFSSSGIFNGSTMNPFNDSLSPIPMLLEKLLPPLLRPSTAMISSKSSGGNGLQQLLSSLDNNTSNSKGVDSSPLTSGIASITIGAGSEPIEPLFTSSSGTPFSSSSSSSSSSPNGIIFSSSGVGLNPFLSNMMDLPFLFSPKQRHPHSHHHGHHHHHNQHHHQHQPEGSVFVDPMSFMSSSTIPNRSRQLPFQAFMGPFSAIPSLPFPPFFPSAHSSSTGNPTAGGLFNLMMKGSGQEQQIGNPMDILDELDFPPSFQSRIVISGGSLIDKQPVEVSNNSSSPAALNNSTQTSSNSTITSSQQQNSNNNNNNQVVLLSSNDLSAKANKTTASLQSNSTSSQARDDSIEVETVDSPSKLLPPTTKAGNIFSSILSRQSGKGGSMFASQQPIGNSMLIFSSGNLATGSGGGDAGPAGSLSGNLRSSEEPFGSVPFGLGSPFVQMQPQFQSFMHPNGMTFIMGGDTFHRSSPFGMSTNSNPLNPILRSILNNVMSDLSVNSEQQTMPTANTNGQATSGKSSVATSKPIEKRMESRRHFLVSLGGGPSVMPFPMPFSEPVRAGSENASDNENNNNDNSDDFIMTSNNQNDNNPNERNFRTTGNWDEQEAIFNVGAGRKQLRARLAKDNDFEDMDNQSSINNPEQSEFISTTTTNSNEEQYSLPGSLAWQNNQKLAAVSGTIKQTISGPGVTVERVIEVPPHITSSSSVGITKPSEPLRSRLSAHKELNNDGSERVNLIGSGGIFHSRSRPNSIISERMSMLNEHFPKSFSSSNQHQHHHHIGVIGKLFSDLANRPASKSSSDSVDGLFKNSKQPPTLEERDDLDEGETSDELPTPPKEVWEKKARGTIRIKIPSVSSFNGGNSFLNKIQNTFNHGPAPVTAQSRADHQINNFFMPPAHFTFPAADGSNNDHENSNENNQTPSSSNKAVSSFEDTLNSMEDRLNNYLSVDSILSYNNQAQEPLVNNKQQQQQQPQENSDNNPFTSPSSPLFGFPTSSMIHGSEESKDSKQVPAAREIPSTVLNQSIPPTSNRKQRSFTYHSNNEIAYPFLPKHKLESQQQQQQQQQQNHETSEQHHHLREQQMELTNHQSRFMDSNTFLGPPAGIIMGRRLDDLPMNEQNQRDSASASNPESSNPPQAFNIGPEGEGSDLQQQSPSIMANKPASAIGASSGTETNEQNYRTIVV